MPDFRNRIRRQLEDCELSPAREAEIVDEVAEHLNDRYQALLLTGASSEEATRTVITELEKRDFVEELRQVEPIWTEPIAAGSGDHAGFWARLAYDVQYNARVLFKNPGFAIVCVLSLALGIGVNTAIFQLIDALRLQTLPVTDPQRLANITIDHEGRTGTSFWFTKDFSYPIWEQVRDRQQGFSSVAAWGKTELNLVQGGEVKPARGIFASGGFFEVLEMRPALGRLLSPPDDHPGCGPGGVVLSYAFWQSAYGGSNSVIGQKLVLKNHSFQVVGVTAPGYSGLLVGEQFDVVLPLCAETLVDDAPYDLRNPTYWFLDAIGRLKPGWTIQRASAQLNAVSQSVFAATMPADYDSVDKEKYMQFRLKAVSAANGVSRLRQQYDTPLWLLLGLSGLVLLIACANIAALMLARASVREREIAVRLALGASRARIIHQLAVESLMLAMVGAVCGMIIAQNLSRVLVSFLSTQNNAIFLNLHPDWRVLLFTVTMAAVTCALFGLAPALQASRTAPAEAMKASGRAVSAGPGRFRMRRTIVIAQVSISLLLLSGALLFTRTFSNLLKVDPGFDPDHILITDVDFSLLQMPPERMPEFRQELLERVRSLPTVASAAGNEEVLLSGSGWNDYVSIKGTSIERTQSDFNAATPGYFETLRIPLLAGRDFSSVDTATSPRVAIVNQVFAKTFFDGANPLGRTFTVKHPSNQPALEYQVIGLVGNTKYLNLREDFPPIAFVPIVQRKTPEPGATITVRSKPGSTGTLPDAIRSALLQINPGLILQFTDLKAAIRQRLTRERLMTVLAGFFAGLAVLLAGIGVYGVSSYMVSQRRNEIGIRMALGATRGRILALVMAEAARLLAAGVTIGVFLTLSAAPTARAFLFGLQPRDPLTLAIAVAGLGVVAILASLLPARRAARVDPMIALRDE
jgi:putative ABC transport system permease protein